YGAWHIVLPCMASLVAKKKGNKLYYYVVESARVDGKPRIVHQAYLGTAEKLAEMVRDRTAPVPLAATTREFGLPAALWAAAQQTGVWDLLHSLWPTPRSGPSPAHYLLLAAIHRICQPGPKTEVPDWYRSSILSPLWEFPEERFTSQAFWDAFEQILPEGHEALSPADDPLEQAQLRLLGLWKEKQLVSRRLLAYDTTNFYTYIASSNGRNQLAQRGHNKQGRHNLRQVGLSYVLDGEHGLSLCHHVYPGNVADVEEFSTVLTRITRMLDQNQIARETVTLVLDKGSAALANTVALEEAGVGWISALPWNQAPAELRSRATEELPACSSAQPGVRAAAEKTLVHGREYLCVVKYSASFAGEQLHSLTTSLSRVLQSLRRLAMELKKPKARSKQEQIERKIRRWLSAPFLAELVRYQLQEQDGKWQLQFDFDSAALPQLLSQRLGRTVLLTNRMDWSAKQVVAGYSGQQSIERVFRGLKDGQWLGWDPMLSLDRPQDSHPRLLLHVGYLPVAVCAPAGQSWVGGSVGRATARGTRANQTVRSTLSASGRKGTAPYRLCALAAVSRPTSLGQDSGPCCHGFVVPNVGNTTQCF
ncbi:MAG TPA: IS1634 family transposase, partial [Candidatus Polarisedimenticolia bacterium]|nr:IS1634 family transposase [Candidatus Polarisedimenticolia bacterium]